MRDTRYCSAKPGRPDEVMHAMVRLQDAGVKDVKYLIAYIEKLEGEIDKLTARTEAAE
jgi:hypothetical protein